MRLKLGRFIIDIPFLPGISTLLSREKKKSVKRGISLNYVIRSNLESYATVVKVTQHSKSKLKELTKAQLVEKCRKHNRPISGNKAELVRRLLGAGGKVKVRVTLWDLDCDGFLGRANVVVPLEPGVIIDYDDEG